MLDILKTSKLLLKVAVQCYTPTGDVSTPPATLDSLRFFVLAVLVGVMRYLVILLCISLMAKDVEHLSVCLLAICISLEKCSFKSFAHL